MIGLIHYPWPSSIHFAYIGLWHDQSRGSSSNAGKMCQTWSTLSRYLNQVLFTELFLLLQISQIFGDLFTTTIVTIRSISCVINRKVFIISNYFSVFMFSLYITYQIYIISWDSVMWYIWHGLCCTSDQLYYIIGQRLHIYLQIIHVLEHRQHQFSPPWRCS